MPDTGHIFISYARKDGSEYANRLDTTLPQLGFTTWRDKRGIDPTQDFTAEIENAIAASACVVTCITPDVRRDNSFVRREIAYAQILNKPIIVARFDDVPPPILIVNHTWIDFFRDWEASFSRLIEVIRSSIGGNTPAQPLSQPTPDPMRDYLQGLYGDIVNYLNATVFSYIEVKGKATPDAVHANTSGTTLMRMGFKARSKPDETETSIQNFADGFTKYQGRVLLLGEPGAGKTTALMAFARDAIARRLENPDAALPLLARCALWDAYRQPSLPDWFAELTGLPAVPIASTIEQGKALLILDGLDELGRERPTDPEKPDGEKFDPRLRFIQLIPANNQVVVSSRIVDYDEIGTKIALNGAVTLQDLTDSEIQAYLQTMPQLWLALQNDQNLRDIARVPLLLSLLTFAYEATPDALRDLADLREGDLRDAIFGQYVRERYRHEEERLALHGKPLLMTLDDLEDKLGWLALDNASTSDETNIIYPRHLARVADKQAEVLANLAKLLNILVKSANSTLHFIHLSLRDFFAIHKAFRILEQPFKDNRFDIYDRRRAIGAIRTIGDIRAIPLLVKTLNDPDELIRIRSIYALTAFNDDKTTEILISKLKDKNEFVRYTAIEALSRASMQPIIQALIEVLSDPNEVMPIQRKVIKTLLTINTPEALEAVSKWRKEQAEKKP